MFSLIFKGRFELENPDEFLQDMQELIKKYNVTFYGRVEQENLEKYVDFQKIEDEVSINEEKNA